MERIRGMRVGVLAIVIAATVSLVMVGCGQSGSTSSEAPKAEKPEEAPDASGTVTEEKKAELPAEAPASSEAKTEEKKAD